MIFFFFNPRLNCSHVGRSASGIASHSFFCAWRIQLANSAFLVMSLIFYSHSQHINRSRSNHSAASSRSMWCCSPHPQQVQETLFAGRANKTSVPDSKTSSQVIISLITENSISQTTKKSTVKTKKNEKKLFYFMLTLGTILSHRTAC